MSEHHGQSILCILFAMLCVLIITYTSIVSFYIFYVSLDCWQGASMILFSIATVYTVFDASANMPKDNILP
jgi:hypothetical protein